MAVVLTTSTVRSDEYRYLGSCLIHILGLPCDISALRSTNSVILGLLVYIPAVRLFLGANTAFRVSDVTLQDTKRLRTVVRALHGALNICLFPPLFFFCALYYTDVASTGLVLAFLDLRQDRGLKRWPSLRNILLVLTGILALSLRQTNVFWVAILPAGLEIVELLKSREQSHYNENNPSSFKEVIKRAFEHGTIHDPSVSEAYIEDFAKFGLSVVASTARLPVDVARETLPYAFLVACFGIFVIINGGVVLGDKGNHVATIHVPQMLYIWPYIFFFSFTLIVPRIRALISPLAFLPHSFMPFRPRDAVKAYPRPFVLAGFLFSALLAIHYNTIVHPFTLADNRHYVFYVFRILLRHPLLKYLGAPAYVFCGWAVILTLALPTYSYGEVTQKDNTTLQKTNKQQHAHNLVAEQNLTKFDNISCKTSYTSIWLASTTLCLISAPLVEPRYVILPWILWRLRMGSPNPTTLRKPAASPTNSIQSPPPPNPVVIRLKHVGKLFGHGDPRLFSETIWFVLVNSITGYMFLYRGFTWSQEPGVVQRFMW